LRAYFPPFLSAFLSPFPFFSFVLWWLGKRASGGSAHIHRALGLGGTCFAHALSFLTHIPSPPLGLLFLYFLLQRVGSSRVALGEMAYIVLWAHAQCLGEMHRVWSTDWMGGRDFLSATVICHSVWMYPFALACSSCAGWRLLHAVFFPTHVTLTKTS
jgi:hypothetical protein